MLDRLGKAVSSGDLAVISACYEYPAMIVSDEGTIVVEKPEQIEEFMGKGREQYISQGILTTKGELIRYDLISSAVAAIDVRWPGFDKDGKENYTETSHYIVVAGEDSEPLIRVAMSRSK